MGPSWRFLRMVQRNRLRGRCNRAVSESEPTIACHRTGKFSAGPGIFGVAQHKRRDGFENLRIGVAL